LTHSQASYTAAPQLPPRRVIFRQGRNDQGRDGDGQHQRRRARTPDARDARRLEDLPGVKALNGVQLKAWGGEVLALMGENGAGKSTLMKVLSGANQADPGGEILIDGVPVQITDPIAAKGHGVAIIYQELALAPNLTVAENIYLGVEIAGRGGLVDRRAMAEGCRPVLERLGAPFGPGTVVGSLSIAEQQLVEIARALHAKSKILVLDEPTTALSSRETERLFALVRQLRAEGIALIYISHRMAEVYELADRVSVLRDGLLCRHAQPRRAECRVAGQDDGRARPVDLLQEGARPPRRPRAGGPGGEGRHRRRQAGEAVQLPAPPRRGAGHRRAGGIRPDRAGAADLRRRSEGRAARSCSTASRSSRRRPRRRSTPASPT
jgi:ABC-type multidrug transport system ATPase subunit